MPRFGSRKSATKKLPSPQGTLTIERISAEPFFDTREEIRTLVQDMRSGTEVAELKATLRIWEQFPRYVFLIQNEDAELRKKTGTDKPVDMFDSSLKRKISQTLPPYDGINKWNMAHQELQDAFKIASTSLMKIAGNNKIDDEPIALASQVVLRVYRNGSLNNLPYRFAQWPQCADLLDLSDREHKEINFGQMQIERIREEVFFATPLKSKLICRPIRLPIRDALQRKWDQLAGRSWK